MNKLWKIVIWLLIATVALHAVVNSMQIKALNTRIEEAHSRIENLHTYTGFNKMKCNSRGGILIGTWEPDGKDRLVIKLSCRVNQQAGQKEIEL